MLQLFDHFLVQMPGILMALAALLATYTQLRKQINELKHTVNSQLDAYKAEVHALYEASVADLKSQLAVEVARTATAITDAATAATAVSAAKAPPEVRIINDPRHPVPVEQIRPPHA